MKILIVCLITVMSISAAFAQPLTGTRSSALMPGDSAIFNTEFIDPLGLPGFQVSIRARSGGANEEYSIPLSHIDFPPYYVNTYAGSWVFEEPGAAISYYARAEADTFLISQSYKNTGNNMPPEPTVYADLIADAIGDTMQGTMGPWLDLTGTGITYSDTRIFGRLQNVGGGWPTDQSFNYFFYAFILYPADTLATTVTAMVYGNIPFIFTPGLYTLDIQDTTFQFIADIDYATSADLHLSCSIDDLLSAPGWDTWPPETGFVITAGVTFTVYFASPTFNDFTYPSAFVPETHYLDTHDNSPPELAWEINPVPEDYIDAGLYYSDSDNNLPVVKSFYFDDVAHEMGTFDRDYTDLAYFQYRLEWPDEGGWHTYYFRFSDGAAVVETPLDSVYLSPIGVEDNPVPSEFALNQNYPNPFNARTTIRIELPEPGPAELTVYDITGKSVKTLINEYMQAGSHSVVWDGTNSFEQTISSGIYVYRLTIGNYSVSRRMILLK